MHWVGRTYATEHHVTLASLAALPAADERSRLLGRLRARADLGARPGAPGLEPEGRGAGLRPLADALPAHSCVHGLGHAYMRAYMEALPLALRLCGRLPQRDVVDCAQGAFHDYWFAEGRLDGIQAAGAPKTPRQLCGAQPARFVRACWYRAFLESPPDRPLDSASQLRSVCRGLTGLQLEGCLTGAAAIVASTDPARQLDGCATLDGGSRSRAPAAPPCTTCSARRSRRRWGSSGTARLRRRARGVRRMDREVAQRGHGRHVPRARVPAGGRGRPAGLPARRGVVPRRARDVQLSAARRRSGEDGRVTIPPLLRDLLLARGPSGQEGPAARGLARGGLGVRRGALRHARHLVRARAGRGGGADARGRRAHRRDRRRDHEHRGERAALVQRRSAASSRRSSPASASGSPAARASRRASSHGG